MSSPACLVSNMEKDQPSWQTTVITVVSREALFMSFVCGVGIIANTLAICIVLSSWSQLRLSARCVFIRALADNLFLFTIAFDIPMHMEDSWLSSILLCKFRSVLAIVGPLVSSALLTALTAYCFIDFCIPGIPLKDRSALLETISIVAWSVSFIFGIPTFLQSEVLKEVTREHFHCVSLPLSEDITPSQILRCFFIFLVFLVPLITNWVFIINMFYHKSKRLIPDQFMSVAVKPDMKLCWKLPVTLSLVFTICQIPYWIPFLIREMLHDADFSDAALMIFPATMCLPAVNAAVNPILCICFMKDLQKPKVKDEDTQEEMISLASSNHCHCASSLSLK